MWFGGLEYILPGVFVSLGCAVIGCFFSLIAWIGVVSNLPKGQRWNIPSMLYTLSASSFLGLAGLLLYFNLRPDAPGIGVFSDEMLSRLWTSSMVAGFVFVLITMLLAYLYSGPGRRFILVGTILLFLINALGFIGFTLMHGSS
jgi:hypothetical protein